MCCSLAQIEELGSEGRVEEAQGMMKLVEQLKEERELLSSTPSVSQKASGKPARSRRRAFDLCPEEKVKSSDLVVFCFFFFVQTIESFAAQEKQMEVCEVCGAFLIVGDAQSRVDDHLMGKQHMGYAKIKSTVEELKVSRWPDTEKQTGDSQT